MIPAQRAGVDAVERGQSGRRTLGQTDRHCAVQLDDRRRRHGGQRGVEADDPRPVGRLPGCRPSVAGGDGRLQSIGPGGVERTGALEAGQAARDARAVPARAVLLGEQDELAVGVGARRRARGLQLHQRQ